MKLSRINSAQSRAESASSMTFDARQKWPNGIVSLEVKEGVYMDYSVVSEFLYSDMLGVWV